MDSTSSTTQRTSRYSLFSNSVRKSTSREAQVFFDLLRLEDLVQVLVDALVLDIAEDQPAFHDLEIRSALIRFALRLMLHMDADVGLVGNRLKQRFERRAVAVLCLILDPRLAESQQILFEGALHARFLPARIVARNQSLTQPEGVAAKIVDGRDKPGHDGFWGGGPTQQSPAFTGFPLSRE